MTESEKASVGVGALSKPPDHRRQELALNRRRALEALRQRGNVTLGPFGIREANRSKSRTSSLLIERRLIGT